MKNEKILIDMKKIINFFDDVLISVMFVWGLNFANLIMLDEYLSFGLSMVFGVVITWYLRNK